jgi:Ser/Thr protein kinase RdoA (MazF antagonist)
MEGLGSISQTHRAFVSAALLQFAHRSWPAVVSATASIEPVTARRLSDGPLFRIVSDGESYALRGWSKARLVQAKVATRFERHLAKSKKLCVPSPIVSDTLSTLAPFQDCYWELTPWLAGESDFEEHPTRERLESMCQSLAVLHLEAKALEIPPQDSRWDQRAKQLADLARSLDAGELLMNHEQLDLPADVSNSLRRAVAIVNKQAGRLQMDSTSRQWIWGDSWHHNFLFDGDRVVGLVDFATVRVDTPLADLARLLGSATTDHPDWWQAGSESYARVRRLSVMDHELIRHLGDVGTVVSLGNWLRWLGVEQRNFANPTEAHRRLHHFHRRLTELLARNGPP